MVLFVVVVLFALLCDVCFIVVMWCGVAVVFACYVCVCVVCFV